jgi:formylmethanofuran dehydrogenase subunit E
MKSYQDVVDFHGHSCPGLAIGYRVALAAVREAGLGAGATDEEFFAVVENDSCAVDAVQVLTGCTFGKGNLIFRDFGKQVYTFAWRSSHAAVRIAVHAFAVPETEREKDHWRRYSQGDRSEEVLQTVHDRKAAKTKAILDVAERELLSISHVTILSPPTARIYRTMGCEVCGERVAEPKVRVRDGKVVCIPCFEGG